MISNSLALYVIAAGDRIVIANALGLGEVGRYVVAYSVGSVGLLLAGAVSRAWGPVIYRADEAERWEAAASTAAFLASGAALLTGALAFSSPFLLGLVAPPSYSPEDLVPVSAVVATATVPLVIYFAGAHCLIAFEKTRALAIMTFAAAAFNVAATILFVQLFGLVGAAIATAVAYLLQALGVATWVWRLTGIGWPLGAWCTSVVAAALFAVLAVLEPLTGAWAWIRVLEVAALAAAATLLLIRGSAFGSQAGTA